MNASQHARNLEEQANKLEKLLTDTSKFAEKAVNASNAYSNLAKAIKDALKIAQEADRFATDAQKEVRRLFLKIIYSINHYYDYYYYYYYYYLTFFAI